MLKFAVKRKAVDIFHEAVLTKDIARVKFLLANNNKQFNVDELDKDGLTALQRCCFTGNTKLVQVLVTYGANLLIQDKEGWTLVHAAAVAGNNAILRYLVAVGADISVKNDQGDLAIDLTSDIEGFVILADAMQKQGLTAELENFLAKTPDIKTRLQDKLTEVKQQVAAFRDLSRNNNDTASTTLFPEKEFYPCNLIPENSFAWREFVRKEGNERFVYNKDATSTLGKLSNIATLTRTASLSEQDNCSLEIPNCLKTDETGKVYCVKCEKRKGDNYKRSSTASNTSLSSDSSTDSAYHSITSTCQSNSSLPVGFLEPILPDKGSSIHYHRSGSWMPSLHKPLSKATHLQHNNARRVHSSPSTLVHSVTSATSSIIKNSHLSTPENERGSFMRDKNVNALNEKGMSLLHEASARGDARIVAYLLNSGAEVNRQSIHGSTPLHEAASSGSLMCTLMLIDAGADLFAETDSGLLPIDQARNNDSRLLIQRAMAIR